MGVYTIAGGKGGVGKTTTTASLGVTLSEAGYDVALVDADLAMANLADVLGVECDRGVHHVLAGEASVDDAVANVADGLDAVVGGYSIELFESADPSNLADVVEPLARDYGVVLVDTGAGLSHETLVATGLADGTVLVTTPATESVVDAAKTAEFVDHADAAVLGAVVTRTSGETDLGAVARRIGAPVLGSIPEVPSAGTAPITEGNGGAAYEKLAATIAACHRQDRAAFDAPASVRLSINGEATPVDR